MTDYGVTALGFKAKAFQQIQIELQTALQAAFGNNVNLAATSVFGQLVAILTERETSLWQLGQALYNSNNPGAASGLAVDNILALSGVSRLAAAATVTDPQPKTTDTGVTQYGLVLFGTPGTVVPQGALVSTGQAAPTTFALDAAVTIQPASNAVQTLSFSNQPTAGAYVLTLVDQAGVALNTPSLTWGQPTADPTLALAANPGAADTYTLTLTQGAATGTTTSLAAAATAAQIQVALRALAGYGNATVNGQTGGLLSVHFPDTPVPNITCAGASAPALGASVQQAVNNLTLADGITQPFTDCSLTAVTNGLQFNFGAGALAQGQVSCGATTLPLLAIASSTLNAAGAVTNLLVSEPLVGAPAQGVASATATGLGAASVLAGALTTIVTPQAGWTGVVNQLDCIAGRDQETDAAAIARNAALRASRGSGSLASMVQRVRLVEGVTASTGFQNLTDAAQQLVTFSAVPSQGAYQLATSFSATTAIPCGALAGDVATALQSLSGYGSTKVTGSTAYGFVVDFNGSQGGQAQALLTLPSNSTGVAIAAAYGRPPHSVEIVAQGGDDVAVAQAVLDSLPAGMASYGAPVLQTLATVAQGSNQLTLASALAAQAGLTVNMASVPLGTTVASVSGDVITLSAAALSSQTNVPCSLNYAALLSDAAGNPQLVAFSRPFPVLVYVQIQIVTDRFVVAGDANSGLNPNSQWNPSTVSQIQAAVLNIGNAVPIGGLIIAQGTHGLIGSFQNVAGIVSYQLTFGTTPEPNQSANLQLASNQAASFQNGAIAISYT